MPPDSLRISLRMGAKVDMAQILKPYVLHWIQANFVDPSEAILMQGRVPCHTANLIQNWLGDPINYWPKDVWPPSSPDLNPLHYSTWANFLLMVNGHQHPNTNALKASIIKAWADMLADEIWKICSRFRPRIKAIIKAKGGYIN